MVIVAFFIAVSGSAATPAANQNAGAVAIIVVNAEPAAAQGTYATAERELERQGITALSQEAVLEHLVGVRAMRAPDEDALTKMLIEARNLEGRFKTAAAQVLRRQVLTTFDETSQPSQRLIGIAAEAAQDIASGHLTEEERTAAETAAREVARRFPDTPVDTLRHPPAVQRLLARAKTALAKEPAYRLEILSDEGGELWVEGRRIGSVSARSEVRLPTGRYRLWLVRNGKGSLPYRVDITTSDSTVTINSDIDARLSFDPILSMTCVDCMRDLDSLCPRLGASRCALASPPPPAPLVDTDLHVASTSPPPAFSPVSLVPFGVGQFAQNRPIAGSLFAAGTAGIGLWNIIAYRRHTDAVNKASRDESALRTQANVAAALFYTAMAAGIGEAVVWGLMHRE